MPLSVIEGGGQGERQSRHRVPQSRLGLDPHRMHRIGEHHPRIAVVAGSSAPAHEARGQPPADETAAPALPPGDDRAPFPASPARQALRRMGPVALSLLVHLLLALVIVLTPRSKPFEHKPLVIELEFAALGEPEAPEPVAQTPPAPPAARPEPPPTAAVVQPEPPPAPAAEPEPPLPEPAVEPEPLPEPVARPKPKPPVPRPQPQPIAEAAPPAPEPAPRPVAEAPPPAAAEPAPAPPVTEAARPPEPTKGIETGVEGGTSQAEMNRYVTTLFTLIDRKKVYPAQSLRRREEGTVVVRLTLGADGNLIEVASPTAAPERLVAASLEAVRKAAPFPPLPDSLRKDAAVFEVPVQYKLQ